MHCYYSCFILVDFGSCGFDPDRWKAEKLFWNFFASHGLATPLVSWGDLVSDIFFATPLVRWSDLVSDIWQLKVPFIQTLATWSSFRWCKAIEENFNSDQSTITGWQLFRKAYWWNRWGIRDWDVKRRLGNFRESWIEMYCSDDPAPYHQSRHSREIWSWEEKKQISGKINSFLCPMLHLSLSITSL